MDPARPPTRFPEELADRCVKCGLCLPHCPTYGLSGVEGESPRGRIALMQGLAAGRLEPGAALARHLDQCLACRACETVCPAGVPYGEILDAGRALLAERVADRRPPAWRGLLRKPRLAGALVRLARLTGMNRLGQRLPGTLGRGLALLPADARPFRVPRSGGEKRGEEVLLFTGCVGAALDGRTLGDAVTVLERAGFRVRVPRRQACCGAMDQHGGQPGAAAGLAARNIAAFEGDSIIATCATGCAATLSEYGRLAGEKGHAFASRVRDVTEILADRELPLGPAPYRHVALHVPCTQRNVTGSAPSTLQLLQRLPEVRVRPLPAGCCGAAGEMFLARPALSDALVAPLAEAILDGPVDAVVTSNVGCMMHLGAALARLGRPLPVLHPVSLLARSLAPARA